MHWFWICLLCIYSLLGTLSLGLLWVHRRFEMIRFRRPLLLAMQTVVGMLMTAMICVRESYRSSFPCWLYIVSLNLFIPLYFLPLFYQALMLRHVSEDKSNRRWQTAYQDVASEESARYTDDSAFNTDNSRRSTGSVIQTSVDFTEVNLNGSTVDDGSAPKRGQSKVLTRNNVYLSRMTAFRVNLARHRRYFLILCALVVCIHVSAASVQMYLASRRASLSGGCAWNSQTEYITLALVSLVYAVSFGVMAFLMLRHSRDHYSLRRDLRVAFVWCLLWSGLFFLFNLVPALWVVDRYMPFSILIVVMMLGLMMYLVVRPVVMAHQDCYRHTCERLLKRRERTYDSTADYIEDIDALECLERWCTANKVSISPLDRLSEAYSYYALVKQNLARHTVEQHQYLLELATRVVTFVQMHNGLLRCHDLELGSDGLIPDCETITPLEAAAVSSVLSADALPTAEQFLPYLNATRVICDELCIHPFSESAECKELRKRALEDGTHGQNLIQAMFDDDEKIHEEVERLLSCDWTLIDKESPSQNSSNRSNFNGHDRYTTAEDRSPTIPQIEVYEDDELTAGRFLET